MNLSPRFSRRIRPFVQYELDAAAQRASRGEFTFWVPVGNTGGTNVSGCRPMPVPPDLQRCIDAACH